MYEVLVGECFLRVIDVFFRVEFNEPLLSIFRSFLVEREINAVVILLIVVSEFNRVSVDAVEVFLRFLVGRRTETFVVLGRPQMRVRARIFPALKVRKRVEGVALRALLDFHDWRDELLQEAWHAVQTRPEGLHEVYEETFDVRTVVILIRHDHNRTVSQTLHVFVVRSESHPHDFNDILDFQILRDLLAR